jgi:hypothetical protein
MKAKFVSTTSSLFTAFSVLSETKCGKYTADIDVSNSFYVVILYTN